MKMYIILFLSLAFLLAGCSLDDPVKNYEPDIPDEDYTICINEFLAANSNNIADENGDHDDWIEIYNYGSTPVDIGGMYFTDDLENLQKSMMPQGFPEFTTIPPGGFLILWADKEQEQGILHLDDVKLSGDGEDIGLTDVDGTTLIDSYTFGAQTTDVSEGRMPDGGDTWQNFDTPTPGAPNE
jgi:hypothetical protein